MDNLWFIENFQPWFRAFHIVGFVTWLAGLFYLPRLFIYHVEAQEQAEPTRTIMRRQFEIMERRLYGIIMTPGMVLTVLMAIGLISTEPEVLQQRWLHIKFLLVGCLIAYHFYCNHIRYQLERNTFMWTSQQLRGFNEISTLLFIPVVLLAIFKDEFPTSIVTWLMVGLVVLFVISIQLYAKKRRQDKEKLMANINPSTSVNN